ncbi:MAG TPA: hypothetical protein VGF48_04635 [Thermoanaerobaculia bacterium]|jgi:hypothetical protein
MKGMRRLVALLTLCLALPLAAQIAAGPDRPVSVPALVASRSAQQVDIASNGELSLVVWQETRGSYPDIFAARVDAAGTVLDADGIQLSNTPQRVEDLPHVAWDGSAFVVTWTSRPLGPRVTLDAIAMRIDEFGERTPPVQFATGVVHGLTLNNGKVLTVLQLPNVPAEGTSRCVAGILDPLFGYSTTAVQENCDLPRVAPLGNGYILVWREMLPTTEFVVRARRLNSLGHGDAIGNITLSELGQFSGGMTLAVGKSGSDAIVAAGAERIGVVRVTPLFSQHRGSSIAPEPGQAHPPASIVSHRDGSYDVLVHHYSFGANVYRFTARDVLASVTTPIGANITSAAAAEVGGRTFGVFAHEAITGQFVFAEERTLLISQRAAPQSEVAMVTNGTETLIAWLEDRGQELPSLVATLADRNGVPLREPFVVAESVDRGRPAAGSAGKGWWIAWTHEPVANADLHQVLLARHLTADGKLGETIVISETANLDAAPAIDSNGDTAVIVWAEGVYFDPVLHAAVLGSNKPLKRGIGNLTAAPSLVWNGERYFLAAEDADGRVSGTWLDANANPSPTFILSPTIILTPPGIEAVKPSVAWNGELFLVAMQYSGTIYGVTVNAQGFVQRGLTVAGNTPRETVERPRAAWDGQSFVVTWNATSWNRLNTDVAARRVTSDAQASGVAFLVARTGLNVIRHDLIGTGGGTTVLAYSRVGATGSPRLFTRELKQAGVKQRAVH